MVLVILGLSLLATAVAYRRGVAREGVVEAGRLLVLVGPVLLPAFLMAGMMSVLISPQEMTRWLGAEAGARGLLVGTLAGAVTPGGPFLIFPLSAVLLKSGAGVGAVTAYLTSWAMLGLHRALIYEIPILGLRFAALRLTASCLMPFAVGWVAQLLHTRLGGG